MTLLRQKYAQGLGAKPLFAFQDAQSKYSISKKQTIIDLLVTASSITPAFIFSAEAPDPLALKAIAETNPTFDPSLLSSYSEDQLMGIINSAKGKYFEYLVTEKLNTGETVGDIHLPEGFQAVMANSATQPGWDLKIVDGNGHVSEYLQLKATQSLGYIQDTLERYPDIAIVATSEVADLANGIVLDSGMSEAVVREQLIASIEGLDTSFTQDFLDAFNPLIPLVFILATEGYRVVIGNESIENAINSGQYRVERSLVASGFGALAFALGGGWLALPAAWIGSELYNQYQSISLASETIQQATKSLITFRLYQQQRILSGM